MLFEIRLPFFKIECFLIEMNFGRKFYSDPLLIHSWSAKSQLLHSKLDQKLHLILKIKIFFQIWIIIFSRGQASLEKWIKK